MRGVWIASACGMAAALVGQRPARAIMAALIKKCMIGLEAAQKCDARNSTAHFCADVTSSGFLWRGGYRNGWFEERKPVMEVAVLRG